MTEPTVVVAAALQESGRLLAARRSAPPSSRAAGNSPAARSNPARTRSGLSCGSCARSSGSARSSWRPSRGWPLKPGYVLRVWTARLLSGRPRPLEDHDELRWLGPDEIWSVDWLDQDVPAVKAVLAAQQP